MMRRVRNKIKPRIRGEQCWCVEGKDRNNAMCVIRTLSWHYNGIIKTLLGHYLDIIRTLSRHYNDISRTLSGHCQVVVRKLRDKKWVGE